MVVVVALTTTPSSPWTGVTTSAGIPHDGGKEAKAVVKREGKR